MYNIFDILQIYSLIPKDQKKNIICTVNDVGGDFLGPPHGTTPAAVTANKNNKVCVKTLYILKQKTFLMSSQ